MVAPETVKKPTVVKPLTPSVEREVAPVTIKLPDVMPTTPVSVPVPFVEMTESCPSTPAAVQYGNNPDVTVTGPLTIGLRLYIKAVPDTYKYPPVAGSTPVGKTELGLI